MDYPRETTRNSNSLNALTPWNEIAAILSTAKVRDRFVRVSGEVIPKMYVGIDVLGVKEEDARRSRRYNSHAEVKERIDERYIVVDFVAKNPVYEVSQAMNSIQIHNSRELNLESHSPRPFESPFQPFPSSCVAVISSAFSVRRQ